ncbi:hypothetical protein HYH02_015162 [Chlamydomonas schloesseri]|uniref:Uncharacterized protein n=1 Tax=Chlamydomonas schloesseri TaxID=2026947 RepID=A0A835SLH2_9CHLO|nr:hypothetical protein HYH02_015162 [Chlamydomonas schloesseri]|eukprot:KAG2424489.1 hypothetical protein HYH02_015162 [Chlamydomonas schloesseri]
MPYISRTGTVQERRSPWRLSIIVEFFLGIWAAISTFFMTMVSPQAHEEYLKQQMKKKDPPRTTGGPRIAGLDNIGGGGGKHLTPGCAGGG